jgi:S-DNA-T family DNA segregation ATPase FtsK/SpoIIIE
MEPVHEQQPACWRLTWTSGPDAGEQHHLTPGRWLVGRARDAHVRCDDPAVEPFHAEVRLWAHGEAQVVQLSGRSPVRHDGDHLRVGASTLLIEHVDRLPAPDAFHPVTPGVDSNRDRSVRRRPRRVPSFDVVAPAAPAPPADPHDDSTLGGTALVSSGVAFAGALLVGAITHQVLFAVLAGVAALASAATWGASRWSVHRRRRRARRHHLEAVHRHAVELGAHTAAAAAHRRAVTATLADAHLAARRGGEALWQRRPDHADAFEVALGEGDVPWAPSRLDDSGHSAGAHATDALAPDRDQVLRHVPVTVSLAAGARVLVAGPGAAAVARALVVQLATQTGPADWRLVVAGDPMRWRWAVTLPHARAAAGAFVVDEAGLLELAATPSDHEPAHTVLVVDGSAALGVRTSPVRRCLAAREPWAVLVLDDDPAAAPPPGCTAMVVTTADGGARLVVDPSAPPVELRVAGASERSAAAAARHLATWTDPEAAGAVLSLPATVAWSALLAEAGVAVADAASIAAHWATAAGPRTVLGRAGDGVVDVDLVRDGPHALLAGTTGAGKSELLRALVLGLAVACPPDRLHMVLVDFKGGAAFDVLVDLPHVAGLVTDLEPAAVERVLRSLCAELTLRESVLRDLGVADVADLADPTRLPRLLVVVDEFAALATDHPEVLHALVGIARRGRSLGVHLVLATQRPAGVITDEIRANTNLRLALRLHDRADAIDVVGDAAPAGFHRSLPGRCALRLGPDELLVFQTAHVTRPADAVVAVCAAAELAAIEPARPLWCEALPSVVDVHDVPADAVGLVDDADGRGRSPVRWRPADGHLLVAGRAGSGVTTTLQRVAWTVATSPAEPPLVLVIDPRGERAWSTMATHPRCAAVVHPDDRELLQRLLHTALEPAAACPGSEPARVLVVIDGLGAVRRALDTPARAADLDLLDGLLLSSPAHVSLLVGVDGPGGVPSAVLGRFGTRWVHHLHDVHDAALFGASATERVPSIAGRVHVGGGRHAQIATGPLGAAPAGVAVARLGRLPSCVTPGAVPPARWDDGGWYVPIGLDAATLGTAELHVPDGDHVLVAGPARSGRSTALTTLVAAFTAVAADARVVAVAPRRSPLAATCLAGDVVEVHRELEPAIATVDRLLGRGVPVLLAVDDAELVADTGGRLAALVGARTPGLTVVAAARPEALRQAYGHWTAAVRRSGLGLLLAGVDELAGDLLGVVAPRHPPIAARPGLAWVVAAGACSLAQLVCDPHPVAARIVTGDDTHAHRRGSPVGAGPTSPHP